jgi:cell division protein FtsB
MNPLKGNLAYDLTLFEPKQAKVAEAPAGEPAGKEKAVRAKPVQNTKVHPMVLVKGVAVALLIFSALFAVMLSNVRLASLNDQISAAQTQLQNQKGEQVRLNMELESRMSLQNVENYAVNKLGLQKTDQFQVQYVHISDQDKVEVTPKGGNIFTNLIGRISEYLQEL